MGKEKAIKKLTKRAGIEQETKPEQFELSYETGHLPFFKEFKEIFLLKGEEYTPILKGCYYSVMGRLATSEIKNIRVKSLSTDLRIHLTIPVSSGGGKKNIKVAIYKILERLGYKGHIPTSFHTEQFIGKVINRGTPLKPKWIQNKGYLSRDYIILDECFLMLNSKDNQIQETRKNFRIAKDSIGENLVEKKSVDNTFDEEEIVKYNPECISLQFLQPKKLGQDIVEEGDFRRDLVLYVKGLSTRDKTDDYKRRLTDDDNSEESLNKFCEYCIRVRNKLVGNKISFTDEAIEKLIELHKKIVQQGFFHSEKGANFSNIIDFTLQDFIVKLACLIGVSRGIYNITSEMVEMSFMDMFEFFNLQLNFIKDKVKGKSDYGESWRGAEGEEQECLEWLLNKGYLDKNSRIELKTFQKAIAQDVRGVSMSQAQKDYQKFKKEGWIKIEHEFQKYWCYLAFKPNYTANKINLHGNNDNNDNTSYREIISNIKNKIGALPTLPTLLT